MSILMKSKGKDLLSSLSALEKADYSRKSAQLDQMYRRLTAGRAQFEDVMSNIFDTLMNISSLDLSLSRYAELLQQVSDSISAAT